jgi:hypothetical protein
MAVVSLASRSLAAQPSGAAITLARTSAPDGDTNIELSDTVQPFGSSAANVGKNMYPDVS